MASFKMADGKAVRAALMQAARERIAELTAQFPQAAPDVQMMLSFLENSSPQRGIVR